MDGREFDSEHNRHGITLLIHQTDHFTKFIESYHIFQEDSVNSFKIILEL